MTLIVPYIPTPKENYKDDLWVKEECYRFYIKQRRINCNFIEILDLWLQAPYCNYCAQSDPFESKRRPDIEPETWEDDTKWTIGEDTLGEIKNNSKENPNFSLHCKKCYKELRPWDRDDVYVVSYHLEEHYGIPLELERKRPSRRMINRII